MKKDSDVKVNVLMALGLLTEAAFLESLMQSRTLQAMVCIALLIVAMVTLLIF